MHTHIHIVEELNLDSSTLHVLNYFWSLSLLFFCKTESLCVAYADLEPWILPLQNPSAGIIQKYEFLSF